MAALVPCLISCATTPVTEKGKSVKFIQVERETCKELGHVFAQNWWSGDVHDVKNKLRNQAAEMGGNAIVLENRPPWGTDGMRNPTYGLVFNCSDEPQR